jgi:hypothetical protein
VLALSSFGFRLAMTGRGSIFLKGITLTDRPSSAIALSGIAGIAASALTGPFKMTIVSRVTTGSTPCRQ